MNKIINLLSVALLLCASCIKQPSTFHSEECRHFEQKADSVITLMDLDEKIGQLNQFTGNWQLTGPLVNDTGKYTMIKNGLVGSMLNIKGAEKTRLLQEMALESRLKIPLIFALDVIHGFRTIFPLPLAEAASFDLDAIKRGAEIAAEEASASGIHWTFAPMADVSCDARWGRVMEGAGEDAWWASQVTKARVEGFQGKSLTDRNTVMACVKHFAAYGQPLAGKDYNSVDMSMLTLYNDYLPPYKAGAEAGAATFMNAFNSLNGIPATGSQFLQRELLKEEWNYDGFVVSDWGSIREMVPHGYAEDLKAAAKHAINAGNDMDMESRAYLNHLKELVEEGEVEETLIDEAVRRILVKKYQLGLFDDPFRYCDEAYEQSTLMNKAFRQAARNMAKKSIVLLKNKNQTLPLKNPRSIALIGPLMDSKTDMCGFWANEQWTDSVVTVCQAFKEQMPQVKINMIEGYDLATNELTYTADDEKKVSQSDVVIVAVGERWNESGEAKSRGRLNIPESQQNLVKELKKTGREVIVLVMGGRPLIFNDIRESADAILFTWWLGTEAGNAIVDVLSGSYNPSAKLPMTFPQHIAQIPISYNYKNTGRPQQQNRIYCTAFIDIPYEPAYSFGHGLSYTTFEISEARIDKPVMGIGEKARLSFKLKNTGELAGEEVVQLYIRDKVASVTRPVKELKGVQKVMLKAGESQQLSFKIGREELGYWFQDLRYRVEAGDFDIMIGTSALDLHKLSLQVEE